MKRPVDEWFWRARVGTSSGDESTRDDRIAAEAADWWSSLELGTADRDAFNQWRNADPAHALAYARLQANWEALLEDRSLAEEAVPSARTGVTRRRMLGSAGAGIVAAAAFGMFFSTRAAAWQHARTGVGELRRITLPDASVLELNTDTAVSWKFTEHARDIRLEQGEIAMALAAGPPAMLIATSLNLALYPGRFDARLVGDKIGFTVLRGRAVAAGYPARGPSADPSVGGLVIGDGDVAQLTPGAATVAKTSVEDRAILTAWQSGDILFQNASLQTAVDEYNRYLTTKIIVDPRLRARRVGGRFTNSDPTAFLEAVSTGLDVAVRTTPMGVLIAPKG